MGHPRVLVVGLDSVPPRIAFDVMDDAMPCLTSLRQGGVYGPVRSTDPPVTIPAWVTATSGRDPGELGIYGFRKRQKGSYGMEIADAGDMCHPRLWDLAVDRGLRAVAVSVPLTYPLAPRPGLAMTSCFLTPGPQNEWITPGSMRPGIESRFGPYLVDVPDYRTDDKERLLEGCEALTEQHFALFRHLITATECELAMVVDLAPDRLHHALLASILPEHPAHDPQSPLVEACRDYYRAVDRELERTLDLTGPETIVAVISDHGVQPLEGGICVNDWLVREGWLTLEEMPDRPTPLRDCRVDWSRTRAWGEGGHHCRICFNVKGREPGGIVHPDDLPEARAALTRAITQLPGPDGRPLQNEVIVPEERYWQVNGLAPDLIVYWDELRLRAVGTVGHGRPYTARNDTGSDQANHAKEGILVVANGPVTGEARHLRLEDLFATCTEALGLDAPAGSLGRSLLSQV